MTVSDGRITDDLHSPRHDCLENHPVGLSRGLAKALAHVAINPILHGLTGMWPARSESLGKAKGALRLDARNSLRTQLGLGE